ncbi:Galactose oxidase/kelch repeat superfamily protein [Thalictrum thalictroides]|uniref:Galactose oxidase/kelch repeat superfamily protein n=1 Tax=Thalictrum thalictroides TaxID=46969 RepID=A0A7J6WXF6_THATH|nr:Galactose oxidase/kelch repeat superfamily protein [Thalictrum thalictroides]
MTTESCNPRRFSRIMKSCFPNPTQSEYSRQTTYLIKLSDKISSENNHHQTNFSCLPDDLLLECLSRVPLSSLSSISRVCRKWSYLIDSSTFFNLRRNRNLICQTIFAISLTDFGICLANLRYENDLSWKIACTQNVDSVMSQIIEGSISHSRLIAIEKFIYIINRNSTVRYNTWTGGFSSRSTMLFPRKRFAAAVIAGKIYIAGGGGGGDRTGTVEEYNPETDTWQIIAESSRRRYGCIGASVDGVFYLIGGLKISNRSDYCSSRDATSTEARAYACSMDLYDIETRVWLRSRSVPGGGCVVAGCAVDGHVYVLMNHAVELSFWRFDGRRLLGNGFGEWCRLKSPPLPAQVRLDNTVRFSCVGVGEEKVVLIQVMGCIDDLLRRSGRNCKGLKEGLVLVYDKESGEWSRDLDLPEIVRRAACVCVEC